MRKAWSAPSFGIYRLFQFGIVLAQIAFLSFWITLFFGKRKANVVDAINDLWVVIRIVFLFIMLWWGPHGSWQAWLASYLIADILVYISRVVFLSDMYEPVASAERSLLFLLVNYFETILGFALLYRVWGGLNVGPLCPVQALYFSFVSSTTLGYGEIVPVTPGAQFLVIIQLFIAFVFIAAFVGAIIGRLGSRKD